MPSTTPNLDALALITDKQKNPIYGQDIPAGQEKYYHSAQDFNTVKGAILELEEGEIVIGFTNDETLTNGFDTPVVPAKMLAFDTNFFKYVTDVPNGVVLVQPKAGSGGGGAGDFIPLTGTEEENPVTGVVKFKSGYGLSNQGGDVDSGISFEQDGSIYIYAQDNIVGGNSILTLKGNEISLSANAGESGIYIILSNAGVVLADRYNTGIKGIVGNAEFDKQGDRKAFAQLSDVYDYGSPVPAPPSSGNYSLKSVNGIMSWVVDPV